MAQQNVTISLSDNLVRQARHLAVDRGVSLSKFVAMLLEERLAATREYEQAEERVTATREYEEARDRALKRMKKGLPLGTNGVITWTRESLHER